MAKCKNCNRLVGVSSCIIDENGNHHSCNDKPAIEWVDSSKFWHRYGKLHRVDGPATEHVSGTKEWFYHGKRHRVDGPAIEDADGGKYWYYHGKEAISIKQEIKVGQSILIDGKNYLIYKHVGDQVYLALIGNQKVFIRHV